MAGPVSMVRHLVVRAAFPCFPAGGHTVLHLDNDFATVAAVLKEVQQRDVPA